MEGNQLVFWQEQFERTAAIQCDRHGSAQV